MCLFCQENVPSGSLRWGELNRCGTRPNGSGRGGESMFSWILSACASFWNTRHTHLFLFDGIHPIQQTTEVESGVTNVAVLVRFIHFALDRPIPLLTVRTHSQAAYSECHYHQHSMFPLIQCTLLTRFPHLNILATKPPITPTRPYTITVFFALITPIIIIKTAKWTGHSF